MSLPRFIQVYNTRGLWTLVDREHGFILGHSTDKYGGIEVAWSRKDTDRFRAKSLLRYAGKYHGDDIEERLKEVYETRAEAEF